MFKKFLNLISWSKRIIFGPLFLILNKLIDDRGFSNNFK